MWKVTEGEVCVNSALSLRDRWSFPVVGKYDIFDVMCMTCIYSESQIKVELKNKAALKKIREILRNKKKKLLLLTSCGPTALSRRTQTHWKSVACPWNRFRWALCDLVSICRECRGERRGGSKVVLLSLQWTLVRLPCFCACREFAFKFLLTSF